MEKLGWRYRDRVRVMISLEREEHRALRDYAAQAEMDLSRLVRKLILNELQRWKR